MLSNTDLLVDRLDLAIDPDIYGPTLGETDEATNAKGFSCLAIAIAKKRIFEIDRFCKLLVCFL